MTLDMGVLRVMELLARAPGHRNMWLISGADHPQLLRHDYQAMISQYDWGILTAIEPPIELRSIGAQNEPVAPYTQRSDRRHQAGMNLVSEPVQSQRVAERRTIPVSSDKTRES